MALTSKTFRIFVSSTFSDLKEERNILQKEVFPQLRSLCMENNCRFQAIDLRWGVREEAALDQQTMKICLDEIDRSRRITPRPNFIVLLGNRYGWRPLPAEIPDEEFKKIVDYISNTGEKALLKEWYKKDENAELPVHCLRPRKLDIEGSSSEEIRKEARDREAKEWRRTEKKLWEILNAAASSAGLSEEEMFKYEASATEQEVAAGATKVPDAHEHVFCFFRTIEGLPEDESAEDYVDLDEKGNLDEGAKNKLDKLKKSLEIQLPGNIHKYRATWSGCGPSLEHLEALKNDVKRRLSEIILKEIKTLEEVDPLKKEIAAHETFGEERAQFFTGRVKVLNTIANYISNTDPHPLIIFGDSGTGKSALIAQAKKLAEREIPGAETPVRFIGATPSSSDGRALLESLCRQISRAYGRNETAVPSDFKELVEDFPRCLSFATQDKPLIVFIDAVNQLSDSNNARNLTWLPADLPDYVRIIVSTIPGECKNALEAKLLSESLVKLESMPLDEGQNLLKAWLKDARRNLQDNQEKELLDKFAQAKGLPLYLKLAFEEARQWKSYMPLTPLSPDIQGIIRDLFARLSLDENHGELLVSRTLGYLAASKNGLSEDEMLDILSQDKDVFEDFKKRAFHEPPQKRLPVIIWSRLYFDLEPYLTERQADGTSLMAFYHPLFEYVVAGEYLAGEAKSERHLSLARYFSEHKLHNVHEGERIPNLRKLSELPYQQAYAGLRDDLKSTLLDFAFIEAKVASFGPQPLVEDYDVGIAVVGMDESLQIVCDAIRLSAHVLVENQKQTPTQLTGRLFSIKASDIQKLLAEIRQWDRYLWLRPLTATLIPPGGPLLRTMAGHRSFIEAVAVTPDGRFAVSGEYARDMPIRIWDLHTGLLLNELASQSRVECLAVTPDGSEVISGSGASIKMWNLTSGEQTLSIDVPLPDYPAHNKVTGLAATPDGKRIICAHENTIIMLDLERETVVETLTISSKYSEVSSVAISKNGKIAVSVTKRGNRPEVWDLVEGQKLPCPTVSSDWGGDRVALSSDGRLFVTIGFRRWHYWDYSYASLRLYNLETKNVTELSHDENFSAVAITPDGRQVITGSGDGFVSLLDLSQNKKLTLGRHDDTVTCLAVSLDGKLVVSGSNDRTIKAWNLRAALGDLQHRSIHFPGFSKKLPGQQPNEHIPADREAEIGAVAVSANGRRVVSSPGTRGTKVLAITPKGKKAVTASSDSISIWDINSNKIGSILDESDPEEEMWQENPYRQIDQQEGLLGPGEDMIYLGEKVLRVWDLEQLKKPLKFKGHDREILAIAMSHRGDKIVSASSDHTLKIWDLETGNQLQTLQGHTGVVISVAIAPDDSRIISGSADRTVKIWDLNSGSVLATLEGHRDSVSDILMTPNGRHFVSRSHDGGEISTFKVWNLVSYQEEASLEGITGKTSAIEMSGDGQSVVFASGNEIHVWDISEKKMRAGLFEHSRWVTALVSIPKSCYLVSSSDDGSLVLWDLERSRALAKYTCEAAIKACAVSPNGLTFVAGDSKGRLRFLRREGREFDTRFIP